MILPIATKPAKPRSPEEVFYPDTDGQPMGETGFHVRVILFTYQMLRSRFGGQPDVYVAADMFLYYEQGNPRAVRAPDVMVVKGVGNHERRSFKTWVESAVPNVIFEITSDGTAAVDTVEKPALYARLGVGEYFIFDPLDEYLKPRFKGFRLVDGKYLELPSDQDGGIVSQELGIRLVPEGPVLGMFDVQTGERIYNFEQLNDAWYQALDEKEREQARAEDEKRRAEDEKRRAEDEKRRAEDEKRRADALAEEVAKLRALLEGQNRPQ